MSEDINQTVAIVGAIIMALAIGFFIGNNVAEDACPCLKTYEHNATTYDNNKPMGGGCREYDLGYAFKEDPELEMKWTHKTNVSRAFSNSSGIIIWSCPTAEDKVTEWNT